VLLIENQADDNVPANHGPTIFKALGAPDKEMVSIHGATHYYFRQPEQLRQCIATVLEWSRRKSLLD
jgi:alpha-beta hydrolase superfamily lysophospholipase